MAARIRKRLLIALLLALTPLSWLLLEYVAILGLAGGAYYNVRVDSVSDLGVPYRQIHPLKHYSVRSDLAGVQNTNFALNGLLFAAGQTLLSRFSPSKRAPRLSFFIWKIVVAWVYTVGMLVLAGVHAGPREQHRGTIGWHWTGLTLVSIAGNGTLLLAGLAPVVGSGLSSFMMGTYRAASLLLGGGGLYSFGRFQTMGKWDIYTEVGLWQRGTIYPVQAWLLLTALVLMIEPDRTHRKPVASVRKTR